MLLAKGLCVLKEFVGASVGFLDGGAGDCTGGSGKGGNTPAIPLMPEIVLCQPMQHSYTQFLPSFLVKVVWKTSSIPRTST